MKTESILWLLPVVFMLHDLEEVILVKAWTGKHLPEVQRRFPRIANLLQREIGSFSTPAYALAVAEEFLLVSGITLVTAEWGLISVWAGLLLALLLHLVMHFIQFLILGRYTPAVATVLPALAYGVWALWVLESRGQVAWLTALAWTGFLRRNHADPGD